MNSHYLSIELATSNHWLALAHGQYAYRHNPLIVLTIHARTIKLQHIHTGILARRSIDALEIRYHGHNSNFPEIEGRLLWVGHLFFKL
jgi:hypothetical protein